MTARRNVRESAFREYQRRTKKVETAAPLNNSSVTAPDGQVRIGADGNGGKLKANGDFEWRGQMDTYGPWDNSGDFTNSGGFSNSGPFTNTGPFSNSGTFTNTGPFNNSGKLTNTGELEQNGNAKFNGSVQITLTLDVTAATTLNGPVTLNNILDVVSGQIKAGGLVIDGTGGGRVAAPGATLNLVGTQVSITGATTLHNGALSEGDLVVLGDATVDGGLYLNSLPTISIAGAPAGLLAIDGGRVKRTI